MDAVYFGHLPWGPRDMFLIRWSTRLICLLDCSSFFLFHSNIQISLLRAKTTAYCSAYLLECFKNQIVPHSSPDCVSSFRLTKVLAYVLPYGCVAPCRPVRPTFSIIAPTCLRALHVLTNRAESAIQPSVTIRKSHHYHHLQKERKYLRAHLCTVPGSR